MVDKVAGAFTKIFLKNASLKSKPTVMDQGFGHVAGKDYSTQNRNSDSEETREGGSRKAKSSKALKP